MTNVCDKFRQSFKQTFIENVVSMFGNLSTDKWFLSIGKPLPWLTSAGEEDNLPPASADTSNEEIAFWQNIIAHKKINREDVSIVIPRYDWTLGEVYQPYRPDEELFNPDNPYMFYVLVDEERVYKCIDNNYGASSIISPTHTDSDVKTLSDGYRWKYMYTITENKKKFLVKPGLKKSGVIRPGYMPVENIESLGIDDERYLQFAVQNLAVDGEIVFIYFKPEYKNYIVSDRCLFSSEYNLITSDVSIGGLTASVYSANLSPISGWYNNMVLSVDSGQGQGQRRIIQSYEPSGANIGTIVFSSPMSVELIGSNSSFSIVPNVQIEGDGSAKNNILDPSRTFVNVSVNFAAGSTGQARSVESFEIIDSGKNFTYGNLKVINGLTFASNTPTSLITDLKNIATPIMSPQGGHGSNAVAELGGRAFMVVKKFTGTENGELIAGNEFRQFGLLKNPDLNSPHYRISTIQVGNDASFTVGATAYQQSVSGYTGAYGKIVSWYKGVQGFTGSSELVVKDVVGEFKSGISGAFIGMGESGNSLAVFDVMSRARAGTEGRDLLVLTLTPTSNTFSQFNDDFPRGLNAVGLGNSQENIEFTGSKGKIYRWQAESGVNNRGKVYLEHSHGEFFENENVGVRDRYMTLIANGGLTGIARIIEKAEVVEDIPSVYSQVYKYNIDASFGDSFSNTSFVQDDTVYGYDGSSLNGTGIVVGWSSSGATGSLSLLVSEGAIEALNTLPYVDKNGNTVNALVSAVASLPSMKYRSGQVQYIQNMRPIVRSETQEEEIKLVIEV